MARGTWAWKEAMLERKDMAMEFVSKCAKSERSPLGLGNGVSTNVSFVVACARDGLPRSAAVRDAAASSRFTMANERKSVFLCDMRACLPSH